MSFKPFKRRIGAKDYTSPGNPVTLELPRNYNYRRLYCRLTGSSTVAGGSASGSVHPRAALKAISRIEIIANGRDTVISLPAEALYLMNVLDYGTPPQISNPANGDAGAKTFSASFFIDFAMVRAVRPIDSLFPAAGLSTFDLKITWGNGNDMFTGAYDRTNTIAATTQLQVTSFEEIGEMQGAKYAVNKLFEIDRVIDSATSNFQVKIPTGNTYRGFLFLATADAVPVNTVLLGLEISSGTVVYQKWQEIQELINANKLQYSLETALTGAYLADFMDSEGRMTEILDARQLSQLEATLNVAQPGTTNKVFVYPQELIFPAA